jgi:mutator protein MutT
MHKWSLIRANSTGPNETGCFIFADEMKNAILALTSMKAIDVVIGLVCQDQSVLICQRRPHDPLGGYWEFPGGKQEPAESREQCLSRELAEELNIGVRIIRPLDTIAYAYADMRVRLHPYVCSLISGKPTPLASQQLAWARASELDQYVFPPANAPLLRWIREHLAEPPNDPSMNAP